MRPARLRVPVIVALIAALTLAAGLASPASAQVDQTTYDLSGAVYQGPCDSLNQNPAYQVGDFIQVDETNLIGYEDVGLLLRAEGTIDATLDDLFRESGAYSFVVTDNTDPEGDPVACGRLGGVLVNGQVTVGLFADLEPAADEEGNLVGVAIFGSTAAAQRRVPAQQAPTPTPGQVQPQLPEELPVQAYLWADQLEEQAEPTPTTTATLAQQVGPTATATRVAATATAVPATATATVTPTPSPTATATETPTATATPTTTATTATSTVTQVPPTSTPTQAPPTEAPTQVLPTNTPESGS